ncbi:glycosyl hydrolase family 7 [Colletotrichum gloeosporioides Cg-14]|uniref:Glucanase n=1 Tax=Colletotrichum gloeosporioides (strain Cg-14) TaxID=1237896 RepID=T0K3N1_COLGC|nr:glycosyl hydrolase family 7 [Colletotrichum gloeosporioides Cg-14]
MRQVLILSSLALLAEAQKVGDLQQEIHPKLSWKQCTSSACDTVQGEITIDAEYRWIHVVDDWHSCFERQEWQTDYCNSTQSCTERCAVDGAYYPGYGIVTNGDSISQQYETPIDFSKSRNSRVFLMEGGGDKYQTFSLLGNELAFDVDLGTVPCGLNGALTFLAMDADGGLERYEGNEAGARYGTGYCDASCTRSVRFVGGEANFDGWHPSAWDPLRGEGNRGACCPEFDVWNSNSRAFQTSSKICSRINSYSICENEACGEERLRQCDGDGCDYNPYRLGVTDFYGIGGDVDTSKKFTVVTQFAEDKITKFFIQDGKRIDAPSPALPNFPDVNGLSKEYCRAKTWQFSEPDTFEALGGVARQNDILRRPMVMALSIQDDYYAWNVWLDSTYPVDRGNDPGVTRGPCPWQENDPNDLDTQWAWSKAKIAWSNIRFGPIGSTVNI